MANPLLTYANLKVSFGKGEKALTAVNGIDFQLLEGQTIGIVGESGSGKSVTSLSTMRLLPSNGRISGGGIQYHRANGKRLELTTASEKEMQSIRGNEIAMIFQEPMTSLNPVFSCGEQVAEAIRLHQGLSKKAARSLTIDWFNEVQLPRAAQMYDAYPHQLSGGQKQRVMIAMAMCCEPRVLIADEPTTALDVTVQQRILELIADLQQKHQMGVLFITHDLGVIADIADEVVVMYRGNLMEKGDRQQLLHHPKHPYTKGLLACRPPLDRKLRKLPVVADFMETSADGSIREKTVDENQLLESLTIPLEEEIQRKAALLTQQPILEVEQLSTYFPIHKGIFKRKVGEVKAVDKVSFKLYPGETLGLVGESGCGKTTLGRTILQLIQATSGSVKFKGTELTTLSEKEMRAFRKDIQIIFQDPYSSLNPRLRVGEAIVEPMRVHKVAGSEKERKAKVLELLATVGLPAAAFDRYPHEFSGGQRQRICIARALALSPEFIICDESVSALDVSVQAQVLNLLNELKAKYGFTYIFISHDMSVVKFMSDRMIVMNQGKIEEIGDAEAIFEQPQSSYSRKLIEAIPNRQQVNG